MQSKAPFPLQLRAHRHLRARNESWLHHSTRNPFTHPPTKDNRAPCLLRVTFCSWDSWLLGLWRRDVTSSGADDEAGGGEWAQMRMKGGWAGFKKTVVADKHMTGNRAQQYLQLVCELESPAFCDAINVEAWGCGREKYAADVRFHICAFEGTAGRKRWRRLRRECSGVFSPSKLLGPNKY